MTMQIVNMTLVMIVTVMVMAVGHHHHAHAFMSVGNVNVNHAFGTTIQTTLSTTPAFVMTTTRQQSSSTASTSTSMVVLNSATSSSDSSKTTKGASSQSLPRLSKEALMELDSKGYAVIENFIGLELVAGLQEDVCTLRTAGRFKVAGVGQDASNAVADTIRRAETCFIDNPSKHADVMGTGAGDSRGNLYQVLYTVRQDLGTHSSTNLDAKLDELLYAYYPQGGYYRRHVDSVVNSPSYLRSYSFLLYLNDGQWDLSTQGGALRLHLDSGKDYLPDNESPNYVDVCPKGGTMVIFESSKIPHEVMDTSSERLAVVGWYNRAMTASDISNITPAGDDLAKRAGLLAVAAGLVTVGLIQIVTSM
jgi:SM-20-related protein